MVTSRKLHPLKKSPAEIIGYIEAGNRLRNGTPKEEVGIANDSDATERKNLARMYGRETEWKDKGWLVASLPYNTLLALSRRNAPQGKDTTEIRNMITYLMLDYHNSDEGKEPEWSIFVGTEGAQMLSMALGESREIARCIRVNFSHHKRHLGFPLTEEEKELVDIPPYDMRSTAKIRTLIQRMGDIEGSIGITQSQEEEPPPDTIQIITAEWKPDTEEFVEDEPAEVKPTALKTLSLITERFQAYIDKMATAQEASNIAMGQQEIIAALNARISELETRIDGLLHENEDLRIDKAKLSLLVNDLASSYELAQEAINSIRSLIPNTKSTQPLAIAQGEEYGS